LLFIAIKNKTTKSETMAVSIKVACEPNFVQINPAKTLANKAAALCNAVKEPMALATSFLLTTLLIHAFPMPSVADLKT
jgi:hypothetical protein